MSEKEYLVQLGKLIAKKRIERGMDAGRFSEQLKISRMQLYRIENGLTNTTVTTLRRIARQLKTHFGALVELGS